MIVAIVELSICKWTGNALILRTAFDNVEKAKEQYERIAELLKRRSDRGNDLPKTIEIDGTIGEKSSVELDSIMSVGLVDYALTNKHSKGMAEEFPYLRFANKSK